jgi:hypothetical protein
MPVPPVLNAVMESEFTTLPEFDQNRLKPVSAPIFGAYRLLSVKVKHGSFPKRHEEITIGDYAALR